MVYARLSIRIRIKTGFWRISRYHSNFTVEILVQVDVPFDDKTQIKSTRLLHIKDNSVSIINNAQTVNGFAEDTRILALTILL